MYEGHSCLDRVRETLPTGLRSSHVLSACLRLGLHLQASGREAGTA